MKKNPIVTIERLEHAHSLADVCSLRGRNLCCLCYKGLLRATGLRLKPGQSIRCRIKIERVRGRW